MEATLPSSDPASPKAQRPSPTLLLVLVVLGLIAAGLRLYHLDFQSLYRDEGHTLLQAQATWSKLLHDAAHDPHPAFYWFVQRAWVGLFGISAWSLRLLPAVSGIGLWIGLVTLAWRLGRDRAALLVALLATPSLHLIDSAQLARPYAFFGFLLVLWAHLLLTGTQRRTLPVDIGIAVLSALLMYTDYLAVGMVGLAFLFLKEVRVPIFAGGLLWLPGAWLLFRYAGGAGAARVPLTFEEAGMLVLQLPGGTLTGSVGGSGLRLATTALCLAAAVWILAWSERRVRLAFLCWIALLLLAVFLSYKLGITVTALDRSAMLTPFLLLLLALGAAKQPARWSAPAVLAIAAVSVLGLARGYYTNPVKGGWKQLAAWLNERGETRPIYVQNYYAPLLRYYYPNTQDLPTEEIPTTPAWVASDGRGLLDQCFPKGKILNQFVYVHLMETPPNDPGFKTVP